MKYPLFNKTKIFIIRFVIALYKKKDLDVIVKKNGEYGYYYV